METAKLQSKSIRDTIQTGLKCKPRLTNIGFKTIYDIFYNEQIVFKSFCFSQRDLKADATMSTNNFFVNIQNENFPLVFKVLIL